MKVVSDSSPLIFLSALGLLDILRIEFGEVLMPEAVYQEVSKWSWGYDMAWRVFFSWGM